MNVPDDVVFRREQAEMLGNQYLPDYLALQSSSVAS
jgi:hypothetical protein